MALYGVYGRKTDKEKFAGGVFSEKLHYIMQNGKIAEGCCFHHDGQNFSKPYNITFLDKEGKKQYGWQNTYAISTRMLGVMFAIHSDDKGLILPPKIAPNKVVIVPIFTDETKEKVIGEAKKIASELKEFEPLLDDREGYTPGFKFNEWELKGIPIRVEIGPKDLEKSSVMIVRRDNGKKDSVKTADLKKSVSTALDDIQASLFEKSKKIFNEKVERANSLKELQEIINDKKVGIVPLCKNSACEDVMKAETGGAGAVFIAEEKVKGDAECIICGKPAEYYVYAGKKY